MPRRALVDELSKATSVEARVALKSRLHVVQRWEEGTVGEALARVELLADDDWFCGELPEDMKEDLYKAYQTLSRVSAWVNNRYTEEEAGVLDTEDD